MSNPEVASRIIVFGILLAWAAPFFVLVFMLGELRAIRTVIERADPVGDLRRAWEARERTRGSRAPDRYT